MFTLPKPNISVARKKGDRPSRQVTIYVAVIMYDTFFLSFFSLPKRTISVARRNGDSTSRQVTPDVILSMYETFFLIFFPDLLWKAPELLRSSKPHRGSPKGDVFSFGIILYEMFGRAGPYGHCQLAPKGAVEFIRRRPFGGMQASE